MANSKRGLSPVIATSLLIAIALVLALIIFLWARSFIGEVITKQGEPIENSCKLIDFEADIAPDSFSVVNKGNVPLYGVDIKKIGLGSVESKGILKTTISNGQDASANLLGDTFSENLVSGDQVQVIPIIIGESNSGKKEYSCTNNAKTVTVI